MQNFNLWIHDERFSKSDVVISPEFFPFVAVGDLLEIRSANMTSSHALVVEVTIIEPEILSKQTHLQISIAQNIANLFDLQPRTDVTVGKIDPESVSADFIEFSFRDQYVGRSHMWNLKSQVSGSCVYKGKRFTTLGIRAYVKEIVVGGVNAPCAYITPSTKTIFRSESAKYFIFIQMSKEMFEFEEDGELFYEKCVYGFLPELFDRWKLGGTNHIVSIILFARVLYNELTGDTESATPTLRSNNDEKNNSETNQVTHRLSRDSSGRLFRDFYRVLVDWEIRTDWSILLIPLRKEFMQFQKEILQQQRGDGSTALSGENSAASEGNILEAINLAMNPFDKHYVDRDLSRTGLSIVIVTAGTCVYEVEKRLCRLTSQRMIDNGIALDLVSLSKPPLFAVPLFHFVSRDYVASSTTPSSLSIYQNLNVGDGTKESSHSIGGGISKAGSGVGSVENISLKNDFWDPLFYDEDSAGNPDRLFFFDPQWVEVSFWNRKADTRSGNTTEIVRVGKGWEINPDAKFVNRCKMHDVQMMGITDNRLSISIPYMENFEKTLRYGRWSLADNKENSLVYPLYHGVVVPQPHQATTTRPQPITELETESPVPYNRPLDADYDRYDENLFSSSSKSSIMANKRVFDFGQSRATDTVKSADAAELLRVYSQQSRLSDNVVSPNFHGHGNGSSLGNRPSIQIDVENGGTFKPSQSSPTLQSMLKQDIDNRRRLSSVNIPQKDESNGVSYLSPSIKPISIKSPPEKTAQFARSLGRSQRDGDYNLIQRNSFSDSLKANSPDHFNRVQKGSPGRSSAGNTFRIQQQQMTQAFRQSVINPSDPAKNTLFIDSQTRRWHHVDIAHSKSDLMHWKSLCTPACLPLTTDFFPSDELLKAYQEYTYTVSPTDDATPYQDSNVTERAKVEALLIELVSQRLSQGFQLTSLQSLADGLRQQNNGSGTVSEFKSLNDVNVSIDSEGWQQYYLSLGDHVHQLGYDTYGKNVKVKRYVRTVNYNTSPLSYTCAIWPKNMDCYQPKTFKFSYPPVGSYNWNYLDHLISGYQEEMTDNLRFWRSRFLLIPMENVPQTNAHLNPSNANLDEEELIVAGCKFIEQFEKARWISAQDVAYTAKGRRGPKSSLDITFSSLDPSSYALDELNKFRQQYNTPSLERRTSTNPISEFFTTDEVLSKSSSITTVTALMQKTITGVAIKDRIWNFKLYEQSFIGSECIDWITLNFSDIEGREAAVEYANELLEKGVFVHMNHKHKFLDGHFFYQLSSEYVTAEGNVLTSPRTSVGGWFLSKFGRPGMPSGLAESSTDTSTSSLGPPTTTPFAQPRNLDLVLDPIPLVKSVVIDMDPQRRGKRRETAVLHYDTMHNPNNCYHFQLHWLVCTAKLIQDMLTSWTRVAERCGLRLVEAPIEQARPFAADNPFKSVLKIDLAIPPPTPANVTIPALYFETELIKHQGFILDMEADSLFPNNVEYSYKKPIVEYSQFVHRSGLALVQVCAGGYYFVGNRLMLTGIAYLKNGATVLEELEKRLESVCRDEKGLNEFYARVTREF